MTVALENVQDRCHILQVVYSCTFLAFLPERHGALSYCSDREVSFRHTSPFFMLEIRCVLTMTTFNSVFGVGLDIF
jgi:hypothetical protein